jgi:hypothetical protein
LRRRFPLGLLFCLILAAPAFSGGAASAAMARSAHPRVRIISPQDHSHRRGARLVARVRVRGGQFRAYLNGRDVTRRFHGGAVRTASFRRGADLKLGRDDLFVTVGKGRRVDADQAYFYVERRRDRVVKLKRVGKARYPAPRIHARSQGRLRNSKVWVNGRRVDRWVEEDDDLRGLSGQLGGVGLRYGENRVTVEADQRDGRFGRRTLKFRIPRTRTIAAAGPDRRVSVGVAAHLDARGSRRPAATGAAPGAAHAAHGSRVSAGEEAMPSTLEYSWKLLSAPPGSQAQILEPSSPTATLVPDDPGNYRLLVTVTAEGLEKSVDETVVEAPQTISPMGLPIQTITNGGAVQIGDPDQAGAATYPRLGNWVQMLVLDPDTATPIGGPWDEHSGVREPRRGVLGFNLGEGAKLLAAVEQTKFQELVVLSGQAATVSIGAGDATYLTKAFEFLGGTLAKWGTTPDGASDLSNGDWSLIGHQGLTPGQAMQNAFFGEKGIPGFLGGSTGQPGSLNGYLQSGINATGFQYVSPEVVPIDTKWTASLSEAPSPTQNTILVGSDKYDSAPIDSSNVPGCPCSVGIQLLVLDPSTLSPLAEGTYGVLTDNGSTDYQGIYYLDEMLHRYVSDHGPGQAAVIVLQDFGSQGCGCWPANSPDWLQDKIPYSEYTPHWAGSRYPNGVNELFSSWNQSNAHGFGSVAGNLGLLAGTQVHDIVANYRRPVYVPGKGTVPRTWGGLTVVANTNLFQWSAAYAHGQGDLPPSGNDPLVENGRVTGVLRRDQQGQWEMASPALGAGYPGLVNGVEPNSSANAFEAGSLPELVMAPQAPWPCSAERPAPCPGSAAELRAAMAYIASELPDLGGVDDVRDDYLNDNIAWSSEHTDVNDTGIVNCKGHSDFSEATCEGLRHELSQEFEDLEQVEKGFANLTDLLSTDTQDAQFDIEQAAGKVTAAMAKARRNLLTQEATMDVQGPVETALFVASGLLGAAVEGEIAPEALAFGPGALSAAAYLSSYGGYIFPFFDQSEPSSQRKVPDNTGAVTDQVHNLADDLRLRLTATEATLKHFLDIIRTDPVKLHTAAVNFGLRWALDTKNEERLGQSITIGADQSLYDSLMPLAYDQWILGPRWTDINPNGPQDLPDQGYNCRRLNGEGYVEDEFDRPLEYEPASMSAMTSVGYSATPESRHQSYTVRFLKAREDNSQLEDAQFEVEEGDNYLEHKGDSPPTSLINPLFEAPSDLVSPLYPEALGMSKEEFFGQQGWTMLKLQCGFPR